MVDQQRLDEYLTHLDELQTRIDQVGSSSEDLKRATVVPNVANSSQDDAIIDAHSDLIVMAVRSNQLATATLQLRTDTDNSVYSFLPSDVQAWSRSIDLMYAAVKKRSA